MYLKKFYLGSVTAAELYGLNEKPWRELVEIGNTVLNFKIDTGADINIIPLSMFRKMKVHSNLITDHKILAEAYGGFNLEIMGRITVPATCRGSTIISDFFIIDDTKVKIEPLLNRPLSVVFGLISRIDNVACKQLASNTTDYYKPKSKIEYLNVYSDTFDGLGKFPDKCSLKLVEGANPKTVTYTRVPFTIRPKYIAKLNELLNLGILVKVNEPVRWLNDVVVVQKPDGNLRVCLSPIELNKHLINDKFPIPTLTEIAPKLRSKNFYSLIDIKDAFYHVELDPDSSKLCAFASPLGTLCYQRLPFGLSVAPEMFQKLSSKYFGDIDNVTVYFDDILVATDTKKEMDDTLLKLFERAKQFNVKFNSSKFQYCLERIKFLGHFFDKQGMSISSDRVEAIKNLKMPSNKKQLQKFLGFVNFVREFLPNISELTAPLRELLKEGVQFVWTDAHTDAVNALKQGLSQAPVLASFDPNKQVVIQADASQNGLGCSLIQDGRVVAYASRSLLPYEVGWAQIEKELLSITYACSKFHEYVYGMKIIVQTDHKPLLSIIQKSMSKVANNRLRRLKEKLYLYDVQLEYVQGKFMHVADYLSRDFIDEKGVVDNSVKEEYTESVIHTVVSPDHGIDLSISADRLRRFQDETLKDPALSKVKEFYQSGWPSNVSKLGHDELRNYFSLKDDISVKLNVCFYHDRLMIPVGMRNYILNRLHETHLGSAKLIQQARLLFYWPTMVYDIRNFVQSCEICQRHAPSQPKISLMKHEVPKVPFYKLGVDIAEVGGKPFLVVQDYYSKWIDVTSLPNKTAKAIISKLKQIFVRFGIPGVIVSDHVPFNSTEFKEFASSWGIDVVHSSPNYPKSNGQVERAVGIFKSICRKVGLDNIELGLLNYNSAPIVELGASPAELLQSRKLRTKLPVAMSVLKPNIVDVEEKRCKMADKSKTWYDKTCVSRTPEYKPGETVLVQDKVTKQWCKHVVVKKLDNVPRSYLVCNPSGKHLRRNEIFIKPCTASHWEHWSTNAPSFSDYVHTTYDYDDLCSSRATTPVDPVDQPLEPVMTNPSPERAPTFYTFESGTSRFGRKIKPIKRLNL